MTPAQIKAARALVERLEGYTPGPWRESYERGTTQIRSADNESLMGDETYYPWVPENDADWTLIAAAPDLHAHLTAALDEIERLRLLAKRAFLEGHGYARIELGKGADMDANYRAALLSLASSKTQEALKGDK